MNNTSDPTENKDNNTQASLCVLAFSTPPPIFFYQACLIGGVAEQFSLLLNGVAGTMHLN